MVAIDARAVHGRDEPAYLWLALVLLAAGAVFTEFAGVSYNAMLPQVSTPETVGRISGFGWSMGYFGGIVLLLVCYVGFIAPDVGWFGRDDEGGLNIRVLAVFSAVWFALFALPVLFAVPEKPPGPARRRVSFFASYRVLLADVKGLFGRDRNAVWFLIASALYRDGLAAVFSFGAILAVSVYGMAPDTVLIFGIVANVAAALGALVARPDRGPGRSQADHHDLPDRPDHHVADPAVRPGHHDVLDLRAAAAPCGSVPRRPAPAPSWPGWRRRAGRARCSASTPPPAGRRRSWRPGLFALFSGLFSDRIGIVGIALVLLAGAVAMIGVKSPPRQPAEVSEYVVVGDPGTISGSGELNFSGQRHVR